MGVADSYVKYLMFGVNLLVELAGLATLAVGVTWYLKVDVIVNLLGEPQNKLAITLMVIGGVAAVVFFFGCLGAVRETIWMLIAFAALLILELGGLIACVVLVYVHKGMWEPHIKKYAFSTEYLQWMIAGFCAALGSLEVMAMIFAFYLMHNISKCARNEKTDEEKEDILDSDVALEQVE